MKYSIELNGVVTIKELKDIFIELFNELSEVQKINGRICKSINKNDKYYLSYSSTFDDDTKSRLEKINELSYLYPFVNLPNHKKNKDWFDNQDWICENLIKYDSSPIALRVIQLSKEI